jgi:hypothetical protein
MVARWAIAMALSGAAAAPATGQAARMAGTVRDGEGRVIERATVVV